MSSKYFRTGIFAAGHDNDSFLPDIFSSETFFRSNESGYYWGTKQRAD